MKLNLFILLLLVQIISFAQEENNALPYVIQEPKYDTAPQFPGGSEALYKFFSDSIRYPEPEKTNHLQGSVSAKFEVTKIGQVIHIQLLNGVPGAPNLAKETVRLLQAMPAWVPASKDGKPVDAEVILSVPFKL